MIEGGDGEFTVVDLGSTNGTRLNGRVVPPHLPTPVAAGDQLELGAHMLRLALEEGERRPVAQLDPFFEPPPPASRPTANAGPRSLDTLLGGLVVDRPTQSAPAPAGLTPNDDPLDGLFNEAPRSISRPAPPPRDTGTTTGDHSPPQLEAFELSQAPQPAPPAAAPAEPRHRSARRVPRRRRPGPEDHHGRRTGDDAGGGSRLCGDGCRPARPSGHAGFDQDHAGVARTVIGAMDNNPLKYSVGKAEAVRSLLSRREAGYLEPLTAVEASLDDLKAHELALLEGVQAAVNALLAQFDPDRLEERLAESSALGILLQGGRRAKLWDLYTEKFTEIAEAARVRFMGDVDRAFASAYDRKVRELRARRRTEVMP